MNTVFRRHFREGLPLPLAQLYSRAYNDKEARSRHNNAYYLFESLTRLTVSVLVAAYRDELARGSPASSRLSSLLRCLALPSAGQWVELLREMARYFGTRNDAFSHPMGHIWRQLNVDHSHETRPAIVELYNEIVNGVDGQRGSYSCCSILKLIHALVSYRNQVFGHGAERWLHFYEERMGPRLLPALNEVLADGVLDCLGPKGSMLVFLSEVKLTSESSYEVAIRELVGMASERLDPLHLEAEELSNARPRVMGVLWPNRPSPLVLEPLLLFREREVGEEILFLNSHKDREKVEYLSYTAGYTTRESETAAAMADLLATLTGEAFNEDRVEQEAHKLAVEDEEGDDRQAPCREPDDSTARMGDYEILAEVGRGGMGIVYLARQISLGRVVALKMLPNDVQGDESACGRFRRDIRALAKSDHPNIVKLLDADVSANGCLYYTMEYVSGSNLEQVWQELARADAVSTTASLTKSALTRAVWIAAQRQRKELTLRYNTKPGTWGGVTDQSVPNCHSQLPLPELPEVPVVDDAPGGYVRRICELIRDAARALQAAHDNGIVHRDVSPANLLITPDSSRLVLMDFGLAKGQTVSASLSESGAFVGKLRYAAPEQLATAVFEVGPAADVRGLGVTFWELLTRRRLFSESDDERQLASKITLEDVPRLREVDPSLDWDLEAIVARATERDAHRRIQSAEQFADYLDLYLEGRSLPIRPPSRLERTWRKVRERGIVGVSAAVLAFAIVGTLLGYSIFSPNPALSEQEQYHRRARDLWNERTISDIDEAMILFRNITNKWPKFAKGYTGLADSYILLGYLGDRHPSSAYRKASRLADKALMLNPRSAAAYTSQAYVKFAYEWEWKTAEEWFEKAIQLDADYPTAHHWYSWYLSAMGRHEEAIDEAGKAVASNPTSTILTVDLGWCHYFAREWSEAKRTYERILNPSSLDYSGHFSLAHTGLAMTLLATGDTAAAVRQLETALERNDGKDHFIKSRLAYALARNGRTQEAEAILQELQAQYDAGSYLPPTYLAIVHLGLQRPGIALDWIEKAVENRSEYVTTLKVHPLFDQLSDEPRFQRLLRDEIGLE